MSSKLLKFPMMVGGGLEELGSMDVMETEKKLVEAEPYCN